MERFLFNKVTGETIDLSNFSKEEAFSQIAAMFGYEQLKVSVQIDLDEYQRNKGTNRIVVNFGFDDWVLKDYI